MTPRYLTSSKNPRESLFSGGFLFAGAAQVKIPPESDKPLI